jgi:type IV secretory pathway TraG/TraD family ATPase VirD4
VTRVLHRRLQTGGGAVVGKNMDRAVLDPYGMGGGIKESSSWNALGEIKRAMEREGKDAAVRYSAMVAEGLIVTQPGDKAYFPDSARNFLQGLILFVLATEPAERQHLVRMRELLMNGMPERSEPGDNPFDVLLFEMSECTAFNGLVAGRARTIADGSASGSGDILSTARQQTAWLDYPVIRAISKTNSFYLEDLKSGALNLSVCAPVTDLQKPLAGWFRLLTVLSMYIFEHTPGRLKHPCLFALDEMPSLGHISAVQTAAPLMRGFGIRLLAVTQDIEALQRAYPKGWGGFLGNAEAVFWMGTNHDPTAEHLEKTLGNALIKEAIPGTKPVRYRLVERLLLTADQVKRFLQGSNMIVTRYGKRPMRLKATPYFSELPVYYYDRDNDYREQPLRRLSRLVLSILRFLRPPRLARSLFTRLVGMVSYVTLSASLVASVIMMTGSILTMVM